MSNKNVLKRILKYLRFDLIKLFIVTLLACVIVYLTLLLPKKIGEAINLIIGINDVDFAKIKEILIVCVIIFCLTSIFQCMMMMLNNNVTYNMTKRIRQDGFKKLQSLPLSYLDTHPHGETISIMINDVDSFADGLLLGFTQAFTGIAMIIGTIIFMLTINYVIAIVVIFVTPLSLFVARFITKHTYQYFKAQASVKAVQTGFIDEMITGLKVIKTYNHEDENLTRFKEINDELQVVSQKAVFYSSLTNPCTRFVNSTVYALVTLVGAIFVINPFIKGLTLSVGMLTTFLSYANQYTKPFNEISSVITELQNAFLCASRMFTLLDQQEEVKCDNPLTFKSEVTGKIDLEDVSFAYTSDQKLIENFNLNVLHGTKIAIVGPTGCGKTTLINLLMRFYDVNKGAIKVDDIDIRSLDRHALRENIGMVLQDTWLKNGTVFENITLGANYSLDEVIEACKKSHAHSFIKRLPQGYDTIIGDDASFSIGEKQLLCISRVMLRSPKILILDEATSSIDTRTEIKIQKAFNTLMEGKTSFIVAHRLSTIKEADIILVMKDGNVIEIGNHESLLAQKGFYSDLYNAQFAKV